MSQQLFREKSIKKISSPDQLTDYIKVTNPGLWLILIAIILLLTGSFIWGVYGKLETKLTVAVVSDGNQSFCYVLDSDIDSVKSNMPIIVDGKPYHLSEVSRRPVTVSDKFEEAILQIGNLQTGQTVYSAKIGTVLDPGIQKGEIIIDSVSPLSFILN